MIKVKKVCRYRNGGKNYNILPSILITPQPDGVIIALKWWDAHFGVYLIPQSSHNHPTGELSNGN